MSKNYTNFSKHFNKKENNRVVTSIEQNVDNLKIETENAVLTIQPTTAIGVVTCKLLNVRKEPNRSKNVLCIIDENNEVTIDLTASTNEEFYKVTTASGVEGYCMKKFIKIR